LAVSFTVRRVESVCATENPTVSIRERESNFFIIVLFIRGFILGSSEITGGAASDNPTENLPNPSRVFTPAEKSVSKILKLRTLLIN
jgi:hypothetical protein